MAQSKVINTGFVPIERAFFKSDRYKNKKIFDDSDAWVYLQHEARYSSTQKTWVGRGLNITWGKGQCFGSVRFLASRWKWSKKRVTRFLNQLKTEGKIMLDKHQGATIITLFPVELNEEKRGRERGQYNSTGTRVSSFSGDANGDETVIQLSNNDIYKKKKGTTGTSPDHFKKWTEQQFYLKISEYKDIYPREMLRAFYDHWREPDGRGKMLFQLRETWETGLRLSTWERNGRKYAPKTTVNENIPHYNKIHFS